MTAAVGAGGQTGTAVGEVGAIGTTTETLAEVAAVGTGAGGEGTTDLAKHKTIGKECKVIYCTVLILFIQIAAHVGVITWQGKTCLAYPTLCRVSDEHVPF